MFGHWGIDTPVRVRLSLGLAIVRAGRGERYCGCES